MRRRRSRSRGAKPMPSHGFGFDVYDQVDVSASNLDLGRTTVAPGGELYLDGCVLQNMDHRCYYDIRVPCVDPDQGAGALEVIGGSVWLSGCSFVANQVSRDGTFGDGWGRGGAIFAHRGASVNIADCQFTRNVAATGAAIALDDDSSLNLVNSHFDANAADNNGVASSSNGIYWQNAQTLCTNCIREPSWSNSQANAEQPLLHEAAGGR